MGRPHDAVIVGGGVAGLTAAAFLTRAGRSVKVLEKEGECGGLVRSFSRHGFVYDGGVRSIVNAGVVFPMLRQLGLDLPFVKSRVSVGIEDQVLRLESEESLEDYSDFLSRLFPDSKADIGTIIADIRRIMGYMDVLYGIENPAFLDIKQDREYFIKEIVPWIFRYLRIAPKISRLGMPVDDFLDGRVAERELRDMIAQHFFQKTPAFFAMSYFRLYLEYNYPAGGTGRLSQALSDYVSENGGTISLGTLVTSVDPTGRVVEDANGGRHEYKELIWAADMNALYRLIGQEGRSEAICREVDRMSSELEGKRGGESALTVYLAVDLSPEYFDRIATGHFFYTPRREGLSSIGESRPRPDEVGAGNRVELRDRLERWLRRFFELNTFEISIPVLRDPSLAPEGKTGLIISVLMDYDVAKLALDLDWYDEFKLLCEELMVRALDESIYPGLQAATIERFSATPHTMARLTGNTDGAITGWAFTNDSIPAESRLPRIAAAAKTRILHVHQAGQWTYSPSGVPISILTGKMAADRTLRALKRRRSR